MTGFTLHSALGSETDYNNLFDGSHFSPDLSTISPSTLNLVDGNLNSVLISGKDMTYTFTPPAITGGVVLSVHVYNSSAKEVLTIDQLPLNYSAATLFQNFALHKLSGLFNILNVGNDTFTGNGFANTLNGGRGNDKLMGNAGNDHLNGGVGVDTIMGGADDDTIAGNAGVDYLTGGTGNDRFIFRAGDGADRISDFNAKSTDAGHHNQDHIVLTQALYNSMIKHLVTDPTTHAVKGLMLDFADTQHNWTGSIFLNNVLHLADITDADFIIG